MKKDITNRSDIEKLVQSFYDKVNNDDLLSHIFNRVAKVNWDRHLPIMYDFWENLLFYTGNYHGNPMDLHKHLHQLNNLKVEHFHHWNSLFNQTVDELFSGDNALIAKQRAMNISTIIQAQLLPPSSSKIEL
jgi:hemoglobin